MHERERMEPEWDRIGARRRFGGRPVRAGGFGGGRGRRRRGDVRSALLLLLTEEPRNGYQLMQAIEERSGGRWRPSPGAVYPALAQLQDEGLVRAAERDGTRLFELTEAGRLHLDDRPEAVPPWEAQDDGGSAVANVKSQMKQIHEAAAMVVRAGSETQIADAARTLGDARRALYLILAEDPGE